MVGIMALWLSILDCYRYKHFRCLPWSRHAPPPTKPNQTPTQQPQGCMIQCRHNLRVQSLLPLATLAPSALQSQAKTSSLWPGRSTLSFPNDLLPCSTSHSFIVESFELLTSSLLSDDQATWYTAPTCPLSVHMYLPVMPFQMRTDLSKDAEAINLPSGEKLTWLIG